MIDFISTNCGLVISSTECPLDFEHITVMAWVQCPGVQKSFVRINGMHFLAVISQAERFGDVAASKVTTFGRIEICTLLQLFSYIIINRTQLLIE